MNYTQSEGTAARRRFSLYLVDATDGITPETGEAAGQPQISKAGGAWANTTATLTALGNGGYYVELTAAELDTLGVIAVRYKSANTAEFQAPAMVVAHNQHDAVRLGLTALPNAAAEAAGGLYTRGTGAGQINQDGNGRVDSNATHFAGTAYATAAAALVAAVWDALSASFATVGSIGKRIVDYLTGAVALDSTVAKASALATAQTSIDDLPTNAELATALAAADDAVLAAIAALNNLSSAQAQTAAAAALTAYDPPTHAELTAGLASADDATLAAIAALNNLSAAQVNAEVVDALRTDTGTEVSAVPAAAAAISAQIQFLYQALRNKVLSGASLRIHNDAGTIVATKTQSDDGTTYQEAKAT